MLFDDNKHQYQLDITIGSPAQSFTGIVLAEGLANFYIPLSECVGCKQPKRYRPGASADVSGTVLPN